MWKKWQKIKIFLWRKEEGEYEKKKYIPYFADSTKDVWWPKTRGHHLSKFYIVRCKKFNFATKDNGG
jgi:hypothetical protein